MKTFRRWFIVLFLGAFPGPLAHGQAIGPGSALSLDGVSGYVQATNGVWFSGDFTFEAWVYLRSYNSWSRLFDFSDGPYSNNVYLALSQGTSGLPVMGVFTNNDTTAPILIGSSPVPTNQWVHIAATLSGTTGTIYLNGNSIGSATLRRPPGVLRTNNYLGHDLYGDAYANALIDEIRIWNVARSEGQIQANIHRSLVGTEPGLVGYWRVDEGSDNMLNDSSGNGQTATLLGGASWTNSTVPMFAGGGYALSFDGSLSQYVNVPPEYNLYTAIPLTVMMWFRTPNTTANNNGALVSTYNGGTDFTGDGYHIFLTPNLSGGYYRYNGSHFPNHVTMTADPVNDGCWHHAAMVVDFSTGKLYLDGVLKTTVPWTGSSGGATQPSALKIGSELSSYFTGQLDDVSIWHTAMDSNQIQSHMHQSQQGTESFLIGYWRMDEGKGTIAADTTANHYDGTLVAGPSWVASAAGLSLPNPGYALNFAGTNHDYVQVPSGVWFSNDFTVEGWVYVRAYNYWSRLIDFANGPDNDNVLLALSDGTSGFPAMAVYTNVSAPLLVATNQLPTNQWVHLAATLSGTTGTIYINGVPAGSGTLNAPPNVIRTNNYIGRSNYAIESYPNAIFDEVRIWNVARTQAQIQQDMNASFTGSEANLVGYWRFDEGTGTTTVDATGNGNNAILSGGSAPPSWLRSTAPITNSVLPQANTLPPTAVDGPLATLNGAVNPNGALPATAWFEYGPTTTYGGTTASIAVSNTNIGFVPVSMTTSNLVAGALYHFRLVASNATFIAVGPDLTFVGAAYALGTSNLVEGPASGTDSVLLSQVPGGQNWTASANDSWLHLNPANQSGSGNATIVFSYDVNPGASRVGTLNIGGQLLTVTQAGSSYVPAHSLVILVTPMSGLDTPEGVAVDSAGNMYIADTQQETIDRWLAADGTSSVLVNLQSALGYPQGVAVDASGGVYFSDHELNKVEKWTAANGLVTLASGFFQPVGVALDRSGNLYFGAVTGDDVPTIYKWTAASNTFAPLITAGLADVSGVAADACENVYSTDPANNIVQKWDVTTSNLTTVASTSDGLNIPRGVAVDGSGNLYIANEGNNSIQKWSAADGSVTTLVRSGLNRPWAVAVDDARTVYIADTTDNLMKAFPYGFVDSTPRFEPSYAGADTLNVVLPSTINLRAQFTPRSDQPWLTIVGSTNGVVSFSYTANTNSARTANITLLGQNIPVTQSGPLGTPPFLTGATMLSNGLFQFAFSNTQGSSFTVLTATNLMLPSSNWDTIGTPSNIGFGLYQFTSPATNNDPQRYYRVRSP